MGCQTSRWLVLRCAWPCVGCQTSRWLVLRHAWVAKLVVGWCCDVLGVHNADTCDLPNAAWLLLTTARVHGTCTRMPADLQAPPFFYSAMASRNLLALPAAPRACVRVIHAEAKLVCVLCGIASGTLAYPVAHSQRHLGLSGRAFTGQAVAYNPARLQTNRIKPLESCAPAYTHTHTRASSFGA